MHLQPGDTHKKPWPGKLVLFLVVAQNVTDILAEEAFDALAELLHAVDIALIHLPIRAWGRRKGRNLFVHPVVERDVCHQVLDDRERLHGRNGDGFV